ncbi:hypothetical protein CR513_04491, partial [Mucuna pruriens]
MEEIRAWIKKCIEVEEDLIDYLKVEHQPPTPQAKFSHDLPARVHPRE